jgi:3-methyladenine DNA glycosylase AlkD
VTTAAAIVGALQASADPGEHAKVLARVGDPAAVIGVRMRDVFDLARRHSTLELGEVDALLDEPSYEARMVAVSILDFKARQPGSSLQDRRAWAALYLDRHDRLDQWDLVDRAAPRVIGGWLLAADPAERRVLSELAASSDPNRRRTAITATFWLVRHDQASEALEIAARLVDDPEPLVRSSVAIALREVGRIDASRRDAFLVGHATRVSAPVRRVALS